MRLLVLAQSGANDTRLDWIKRAMATVKLVACGNAELTANSCIVASHLADLNSLNMEIQKQIWAVAGETDRASLQFFIQRDSWATKRVRFRAFEDNTSVVVEMSCGDRSIIKSCDLELLHTFIPQLFWFLFVFDSEQNLFVEHRRKFEASF